STLQMPQSFKPRITTSNKRPYNSRTNTTKQPNTSPISSTFHQYTTPTNTNHTKPTPSPSSIIPYYP
ncbi:hypothetical protein, partial [Bacillus pumilus]|uniref:hypothetical protein n=1 Tax=Bacillus pumilus TaxID=1408 RepID=UPI001C92EC87